MKKLIMILVMAMVAFSSFAKDFLYRANDENWRYDEEDRELYLDYKFQNDTGNYLYYYVSYFDVSKEEAWKIINNEEFPMFEFSRHEYGDSTYISRIPARDYSNRSK